VRLKIKEWEALKLIQTALSINDMRIAELKVKMNNTGKAANSTYKNKIAQLEGEMQR
jgi:hypothetical protein